MPLNNTAKGVMLDALGAVLARVSIHSADPGVNGTANEITGGSPAYARKNSTFSPSASGNLTNNAAMVFDIPGGATAAFAGFWNTAGSVYYGSQALSSVESFGAQGTYTVAAGDFDVNL